MISTIGLDLSDKPSMQFDDLTWGDEQGAMIANSTLMNADKVTPDALASAVVTIEAILQRCVITIPVAWVIPAATNEESIDWSQPGMFKKWLRRKRFSDLNTALFTGMQADEKK